MRSFAFEVVYYVLSVFYALACAVAALFPGRAALAWMLRLYTRRMLWAMHWIAGIKVDVAGKQRLPKGPFIIAAKHHSWGDGFVMFAHVDNLSFVAGDHLERIPLLRGVLKKFGAIMVDNCGGPEARKALAEKAAAAHADGRRILIYPEGNLAKAGERFRYRTGVYYMYRDFGLPVVPVATNLGLFWRQQEFQKHPGRATVEFLDPIEPGLERGEFLARLEGVVETRTQELIASATGEPVRPSVQVPAPDEVARAAAKATAAA
ncbi:MAG TPA: lysophospholipid acyltransferase family protein [Caulobacteraceae bacterium]|jgi:1-acyl-sn-glycerol-3-phosphate acyltransferase|nr:lysophospholipid acyltransferase family protein [Caulobacteraceae bacterium]